MLKRLYQVWENNNLYKKMYYPPGHFYSPIPSLEEIKRREEIIWMSKNKQTIEGIDLNQNDQLKLIKNFERFYDEIPFVTSKNSENRYFYDNDYYSYTDAITLYSMMRVFKPNRIIEIGSGFSSAVMLDIRDKFLPDLELTFIEPFPERLYSLMKKEDKSNTDIICKILQEVDVSIFSKLNQNDFLFVDSSHVSKVDSDVNHILFEILPILKNNVLIHFHDIFYPFEYPKEWIFQGRSWNEAYILKAFLMNNQNYEIKLFSNYLHTHHKDIFANLPLCYKNHGGNIWIRKII